MQRSSTGQCRFSSYSRHLCSARLPRRDKHDELVWANRWYTPEDLRAIAPVQRHKFLAQPKPDLSSLPPHWVPLCEAPLKSFSRAAEETEVHASTPSSRCEQWSTLRQMLPSRGHCIRHMPPKWGTGFATPPSWSHNTPRRSPHINSPMTKYVQIHTELSSPYNLLDYCFSHYSYTDDMHLTNRLFRLH